MGTVTATEILFEHGIDIMSMDDTFNSQLLAAMERYAEQKREEQKPEAKEQLQPEQSIKPNENIILSIMSKHLIPYIYGNEACIDGMFDTASAIVEYLEGKANSEADKGEPTPHFKTCPACGSENCYNNSTCIKCDYQL